MPVSTPARRALLGSVLAGGLVATSAPSASAAAFTPRQLRAGALKVGDLVVGPAAGLVRVSVVRKIAGSKVLLRHTDPATGASVPFDAPFAAGYPGTRLFVVVARGVSAAAVRYQPAPARAVVVDGGAP